MKYLALLALAVCGFANAAAAAPVEQLRCLDDRLTDQQRADVSLLFAQQPANPKDAVVHPHGSAAAAQSLTYVLSSCASQFGWDQQRQAAATQYLIRTGQLAQIGLRHTPAWYSAMRHIAPEAPKLPPETTAAAANDPASQNAADHHAESMILAHAVANGMGQISSDDAEDVMAFLRTWEKTTVAKGVFSDLP